VAQPDAATMRKLKAQGKAMPPKEPGGRPRFPIRNASDLDNAIRAVGRATSSTGQHSEAERAKVRRYVASRAKALGLASKLPDTWQADGSLKDDSGSSSSGSKRVDPDNDGDNDATPAGDTDHDYWTKGGRQKKPLPGKPMPNKKKGG
jgi:hypothetical protein